MMIEITLKKMKEVIDLVELGELKFSDEQGLNRILYIPHSPDKNEPIEIIKRYFFSVVNSGALYYFANIKIYYHYVVRSRWGGDHRHSTYPEEGLETEIPYFKWQGEETVRLPLFLYEQYYLVDFNERELQSCWVEYTHYFLPELPKTFTIKKIKDQVIMLQKYKSGGEGGDLVVEPSHIFSRIPDLPVYNERGEKVGELNKTWIPGPLFVAPATLISETPIKSVTTYYSREKNCYKKEREHIEKTLGWKNE